MSGTQEVKVSVTCPLAGAQAGEEELASVDEFEEQAARESADSSRTAMERRIFPLFSNELI
jgi:hypothetical protein